MIIRALRIGLLCAPPALFPKLACAPVYTPPLREAHPVLRGRMQPSQSHNTSVLPKIFAAMQPDWPWFMLAGVTSAASSALAVHMPAAIGSLVDALAGAAGAGTALGMASAVLVAGPVLKVAALFAAQAVLHLASYSLLSAASGRLGKRLREQLYGSLLVQDMSFFDQETSGSLGAALGGDITEITQTVKHTFVAGLRDLTQILGGATSLFLISPQMATMLCVLLPTFVIVGSAYTYFLRNLSLQSKTASSRALSLASEVLSSVKIVRAYNAEDSESKKFSELLEQSEKLAMKMGLGIGLFQGLSLLAMNSTTLLVSAWGASLISTGMITRGDMISFLFTTMRLQAALGQLSILHGQMTRTTACAERVFGLIERTPAIPTFSVGGQRVLPDQFEGRVVFQDVSFSYPSRPDVTVISNVSLEIKPGTSCALVGKSGSGKSTLSNLLERFYDPQGGCVLLDGHDLRDLDPQWLRQQIAIVSQEPTLFSGTVADNIRYGKPDATIEQVQDAARKAHADEFVEQLPNGYETVVGERGSQLSGGQRQRIAIARAILRDPKILILDEATSALDSHSERLVQDALDVLMQGRTVVIVAHRLSTVDRCDQIVVLQRGRVVESGHPRELLERGGVYAGMVRRQQPAGAAG
eukprot:TRINITY_DN7087_c0_g1_i1.p1 TRINITY_DN7087_c0_g1~~TRINITY_DN7087_c0_g1_i1.p1  ORF type:complete len:641 (+),score=88.23 TRINITY_DN7087_c0_g1_i1:485-2407(+)